MYSWGDNLGNWKNPNAYKFDKAQAKQRKQAAAQAKKAGPRTYSKKNQPVLSLTDPTKRLTTESTNPLILAVDVTGSMKTWPFEIFDRLPLVYQTLSQYRPDLEIAFCAIGDANCDRYPFQITQFDKGYGLEKQLDAIYGEGGGSGPEPRESYGLLAYYLLNRCDIPKADERPFCIVFGDVSMQEPIPARQLNEQLDAGVQADVSAIESWQKVTDTWNVWFLSRPGRLPQDEVDAQWGEAVGKQKHVHIHDPLRAVDYAMGLIARSWGHFDNFEKNMSARQDEQTVRKVSENLSKIGQ